MPMSVTRSHQTVRFLKTEDKTEYWIKQQPKVAAVKTWQFISRLETAFGAVHGFTDWLQLLEATVAVIWRNINKIESKELNWIKMIFIQVLKTILLIRS